VQNDLSDDSEFNSNLAEYSVKAKVSHRQQDGSNSLKFQGTENPVFSTSNVNARSYQTAEKKTNEQLNDKECV